MNNIYFHPLTQKPLSQIGNLIVSGDEIIGCFSGGLPRFVDSKYCNDFGLQWQKFARTQLDSFSGVTISAQRLERCLGAPTHTLAGQMVLEAGSGAGRFTEVLIHSGATVHSFDMSTAVDVNYKTNGGSSLLTLCQADINHMPFKWGSYDVVLCLGVLQHTPNPEDSIRNLWRMVKPGGTLVIDHYPKNWRICAPWPLGEILPLYRWLILKLPRKYRMSAVKNIVRAWFPFHWYLRRFIITRKILKRLSPVIFHYPQIPLPSKQAYFEWAFLDTHDATTDYFKHRRSSREIRKFLEGDIKAEFVYVREGGNGVEARCVKPIVDDVK